MSNMKRDQRYWSPKLAWAIALAALAILLFEPFAHAEEKNAIPAGQVVWQHVGRLYINPNTGKAVYAGYLVRLNGITSPLFNGSPSEATAYFTFSTDILTFTPLPNNGDVTLSLVSAGTFS